MYAAKLPVYQMLPSRSATKPCGPSFSPLSGYSLKFPVGGSSRPSLLTICSVNQREPSVPTAGSWGWAPFVGTVHSRILTFRLVTVGVGADERDVRPLTRAALAIRKVET